MPTAHRLRATLADTDPPIWREIEIESTASLRDLHEALQSAFGWRRAHLWLFQFGGKRAAPAELEDGRALDDRRVGVAEAVPAVGARGVYVYDLGDHWQHELEVVAIEPGRLDRPRCLAGARAAPPEDCGGVPGYEELIAALAGGGGQEGEELRRRAGRYDPERFSRAAAERRMAKLAAGTLPRRI